MTEEEILHEFRASEALLEGHFKLSSGRHSGHYLPVSYTHLTLPTILLV